MNKQYIYRQIHREYENIRDKNDRILEKRREEVYNRLPVVKEADQRLKSLGNQLVRLALRHASVEEREKISGDIAKVRDIKRAALASVGLTEEYLKPIYTCPECKDTGYVGSEKCRCMKKKLVEKYYAMSNLNTLLDSENFDHFNLDFYSDKPFENKDLTPRENMRTILSLVKKDISKEPPCFNMFFYGNSGLGKTFLCSCVAKELLDKGKSVIYMTAYSLAALLENNRFRRADFGEEPSEAVDMLFDTDLLIIDDLGTESPNNFTVSEFFNIINTRLINNNATIISSNLSPNELRPLYSDRIVSRIIGRYEIHHFYGSDIRMS